MGSAAESLELASVGWPRSRRRPSDSRTSAARPADAIPLLTIKSILSTTVLALACAHLHSQGQATNSSTGANQQLGNMSAMLSSQGATGAALMTNASLANAARSPNATSSGKTGTKTRAPTPQLSANSPAVNSRLKQTSSRAQQVAELPAAAHMSMAADDVHETRASVGGGVVTVELPSQTAGKATSASVAKADASPPIVSSPATGDTQSMTSKAALNNGPAPRAGQSGRQSGQSFAAPSSDSGVGSAKIVQSQWRPASSSAFLTRPPQWQQQQIYLEPPVRPAEPQDQEPPSGQLEKPTGYTYETSSAPVPAGGHTHTSPLSPARQEMLLAEQLSPRQRQRQFQLEGASQRSAGAGKSALQLPQFSGEPTRPSASMVGAAQTVAAHSVLPTPPASGPAHNPCRPPAAPFSQQQQQQEASNEIGSGPQVPPRYTRVGVGTRLRSSFVFKILRVDSLTGCELACTRAAAGNNLQDTCRSFNFWATNQVENCELSRHDLRGLKLEDGAQFEQHSQFDFYAAEPSLGPMLAAGSSQALAYSPFVQDADCLDVTQSCSPDGMEFTLRTQEPFDGRIYTYGFYDSCYFDGEAATSSSLRISRPNGFPRCGTQQFGDMITNIVVVQFNDHVQTTRDKKYNLTCFFSGPGEAVVTSNYLDAKVDERSHPIQIEHLPPQNVVTSNVHLRVLYRGQPTNTIAVGDLLTFRLETRSAHHRAADWPTPQGHTEIFATNVVAKDPYSGRQVQLIDARGCPVDPVNVFPELQRTPDGALESEFYAFKIPDSNFLIFQATVRTCKAPCEPAICQAPAAAGHTSAALMSGATKGGYLAQGPALHAHRPPISAPSWGRRRRRDAPEPEEADALSVGESVEHVIPARLRSGEGAGAGQRREVRTVRRPELGEAEEEVKEMFRVYMSRAELDRRQRPSDNKWAGHASERNQSGVSSALVHRRAPTADQVDWDSAETSAESLGSVCLNQAAYYALLFTCISLSLVLVATLLVSLYVARRAKFHVSESIADSLF